MSRTRGQRTLSGSIPSALPWWMWLSMNAAPRLWAAPMAWTSPVRCRLKSSIGMTWLRPPPAAPPLIPNTGPRLGWRMQTAALWPIRFRPWASPTVVVDLPSPSGVGLIAVTSTYLPRGFSRSRRSMPARMILAFADPYGSISSSRSPSSRATSTIGRGLTDRAISRSDAGVVMVTGAPFRSLLVRAPIVARSCAGAASPCVFEPRLVLALRCAHEMAQQQRVGQRPHAPGHRRSRTPPSRQSRSRRRRRSCPRRR